jgi:hypothetical protein
VTNNKTWLRIANGLKSNRGSPASSAETGVNITDYYTNHVSACKFLWLWMKDLLHCGDVLVLNGLFTGDVWLMEQSWLACEEELICDPCGWVALVLEETIISFSMP